MSRAPGFINAFSVAGGSQAAGTHGCERITLTLDAGFFTNWAAGLMGLLTSSPLQLAQTKWSFCDAQWRQ
jgi:hypothetical protein